MMIKADLVTGFLGSGKTSFITEYATLLSEMAEGWLLLLMIMVQ